MPATSNNHGPSHNATLQQSHKEILQTFLEEYRDASKKERRRIVKKAWEEVQADSPNMAPLTKLSMKKVNGFMLWYG